MKLILLSVIAIMISACAPRRNSVPSVEAPAKSKKNFRSLSKEEQFRFVTPTIYYVPTYDQTELRCDDRKQMKDRSGVVIVEVCKKIYDDCVLQGTCEIIIDTQSFLINVASKVDGERRFHRVQNSVCVFGKGAVRDRLSDRAFEVMCIDPYYSIAADLSIYKLGTVIFLPEAVGLKLPDGSTHEGYFIVRDTGGGINGPGRFDFFTGFESPKNQSNPLSKIELNDKNTHLEFHVVKGSKADEFLKERSFPLLPVL